MYRIFGMVLSNQEIVFGKFLTSALSEKDSSGGPQSNIRYGKAPAPNIQDTFIKLKLGAFVRCQLSLHMERCLSVVTVNNSFIQKIFIKSFPILHNFLLVKQVSIV